MRKVRDETKFLNEPYKTYGEEKTAVSTKKFTICVRPTYGKLPLLY